MRGLMSTTLADLSVSPIGFGCMALSHVYGGGLSDEGARSVVHEVIDAGITFLDTSDVYGKPPSEDWDGPSGTNEQMLAPVLAERRDDVQLATKFGISGFRIDRSSGAAGASGADTAENPERRRVDGRPEYVRTACDASLQRLGVETIDLYYLHRPDPEVPVEETVGAMAELVDAGKVRHLGLSEVTADELRRAHSTHPITAVQSEWSVWSRDVEAHVVPTCAELGVGFVPYSPLGRGFLTGTLTKESVADDFRSRTARMGEGWEANQRALAVVSQVAADAGATQSQVCVAWLRQQGEALGVTAVPIPGSRRAERMSENLAGIDLRLTDAHMHLLDTVVGLVSGDRNIVSDPAWISSGREER